MTSRASVQIANGVSFHFHNKMFAGAALVRVDVASRSSVCGSECAKDVS